jgi:hypothetical protein
LPTIFLSFADLKARGIVANWETVRRWIKDEGFPPGWHLGPNTRRWTEAEIEDWLRSRPAAVEAKAKER